MNDQTQTTSTTPTGAASRAEGANLTDVLGAVPPEPTFKENTMKDFLYRTISEEAEVTDEDGNTVKVSAWRTRNSNGHRMIGVEFGKQRIEFTIGDDYEQHARMLMDLLDKVCSNPCTLPEAPNNEDQPGRTG